MKNTKNFAVVAIFVIIIVLASVFTWSKSGVPVKPFEVKKVGNRTGATFAWVNEEMMRRELSHGWLVNDKILPTRFLDNRPAFQVGVLEVVRLNSICLRENLSRLRTTDRRDEILNEACLLFHNEEKAWIYPAPELKYRKAIKLLSEYRERLGKDSHFFPRADNLIQLLEFHLSIMGGANTRLVNAPEDINVRPGEETAGDTHLTGESAVNVKTDWWKTDDNFYYVKGVAWGIYHTLAAVKVDFGHVLRDKNSMELLDSVLFDLERCLKIDPFYICNGRPGGVWPNHSMNLSSPFNDARQKIHSLVSALTTG